MKVAKSKREKDYWSQLTYEYMTEESEDENGIVMTHKLSWTSNSKCRLELLVQLCKIISHYVYIAG